MPTVGLHLIKSIELQPYSDPESNNPTIGVFNENNWQLFMHESLTKTVIGHLLVYWHGSPYPHMENGIYLHRKVSFNPLTPKSAKNQNSRKILNFIFF